jgi:hypothetical protein
VQVAQQTEFSNAKKGMKHIGHIIWPILNASISFVLTFEYRCGKLITIDPQDASKYAQC